MHWSTCSLALLFLTSQILGLPHDRRDQHELHQSYARWSAKWLDKGYLSRRQNNGIDEIGFKEPAGQANEISEAEKHGASQALSGPTQGRPQQKFHPNGRYG